MADQIDTKPTQTEGPLVAELHLAEFLLQARKGKYGNYFVFLNHNHPDKTLRLFRPQMMKLLNALPRAIATARTMEEAGVEGGASQDVALISKRDKSDIMLYVQMFEGRAFIFLRLFIEKEDGVRQPCTYGVQFTPLDSVETLTNFVNKHRGTPEV